MNGYYLNMFTLLFKPLLPRVLIMNFQIVSLIFCHSALHMLFGHLFVLYTSPHSDVARFLNSCHLARICLWLCTLTFSLPERSEGVGRSACVKHGHVVQSTNCYWLGQTVWTICVVWVTVIPQPIIIFSHLNGNLLLWVPLKCLLHHCTWSLT